MSAGNAPARMAAGRQVRLVAVAGPTASGKSALALDLARRRGGIVINADSMQVYRELSILTARPGAGDLTASPHRLYGHVAAAESYSVANWLEDLARELAAAEAAGALPIVVGGTGLYFQALFAGLSPVPPVPDEIRNKWRERARGAAPGELHAELAERDAAMAAKLSAGDTQRLTRALEVIEGTGRSLLDWQSEAGVPLVAPDAAERLLVTMDRDAILRRCDARFDAMIDWGALEEVRALLRQGLPPDLPAMRALGVPELADHLGGGCSLDEAVARAKIATHQYVKRQLTWSRRYMADWRMVPASAS